MQKIEGFRNRTLGVADLVSVAEHLSSCQLCHQQFTGFFEKTRGGGTVELSLSPTAGIEHEHLEPQQIRDYLDSKLDPTDRQLAEVHMEICAACKHEVRSLAAWDQKITPWLKERFTTREESPSRRSGLLDALAGYLHWRPLQVAGATAFVWSPCAGSCATFRVGSSGLSRRKETRIKSPQATTAPAT